MSQKLEGKVALVTGAGRGLGKAIASRLAKMGADLVVHDLRADTPRDFNEGESIEEVAEGIRRAGRRAAVVTADLTDPAAAKRLVSDATRTFPQIDILVCNAGGDIASDGRSKANPNDMFIPE